MFVPNYYWGEVVLSIAYLINWVSSRVLGNDSLVLFMLSCVYMFPYYKTLSLVCLDVLCLFMFINNIVTTWITVLTYVSFWVMDPTKDGTNVHPHSRKFFVSKYAIFHENL